MSIYAIIYLVFSAIGFLIAAIWLLYAGGFSTLARNEKQTYHHPKVYQTKPFGSPYKNP